MPMPIPQNAVPDDEIIDVALPRGARLQQGGFAVSRVIGQGGFGITYHAQDRRGASGGGVAEGVVAIKEFFPQGCARRGLDVHFSAASDATEQEAAQQNFLSEARVLGALDHPGIVRVEATFKENNTAYMVMEFLDGDTLQQLVQRRGPIPEDVAVGYIRQIGAALSEVHRAHFIHRDIKAENIIVGADGRHLPTQNERVVLLDFGLNKEIGAGNTYHTLRLTNALRFGSPGYSPPEQYGRQARFGPFTDIYALGATLHFLLSGQVPPEAPERMSGSDMIDLRQTSPQVSRTVSDAVMWSLELKGDARPQTVQEFLDALQQGRVSAPRLLPTPQNSSAIKNSAAVSAAAKSSSQTPALPPNKTAQTARAALFPHNRFSAPQAPVTTSQRFAPRSAGGKILNVASNSGTSALRFLWSNLVEVLPRLLLIVGVIAALIYFNRNQQSEPPGKGRAKNSGQSKAADKARRQKQQRENAAK